MEMEIETGPPGPDAEIIEPSPEADLPPHARNLIDARNHLVLMSQRTRQWAIDNSDHPAAYLVTRNDVGEQTKIQALRRIESVSLPMEVRDLLDAASYFNECQAESQAAFDSEPRTDEDDLPLAADVDVIEGARAAYMNLLRGYRNWGGYGYHGWTDSNDPESYFGPAIWTRQDCVFRFGRALEREFPDRVHLGLKISKSMTGSFDPEIDRRQSVDITVTIPGLFARDLSQRRFRNLRHDLFVEVEWLKKGRWLNTDQLVKRCSRIQQDLINLQRSIDSGRCEFAAMLIVDDEGFLDFHGDLLRWPPDVVPLIVSPGAVVEQHLDDGTAETALDELKVLHDNQCPCQDGSLALEY
jgi:hypothetical protein